MEWSCSRPLQDGDIVNVDVTVYLDGFHGDTSRTFLIGDVVRPTLQYDPSRTLRSRAGHRTRRAENS